MDGRPLTEIAFHRKVVLEECRRKLAARDSHKHNHHIDNEKDAGNSDGYDSDAVVWKGHRNGHRVRSAGSAKYPTAMAMTVVLYTEAERKRYMKNKRGKDRKSTISAPVERKSVAHHKASVSAVRPSPAESTASKSARPASSKSRPSSQRPSSAIASKKVSHKRTPALTSSPKPARSSANKVSATKRSQEGHARPASAKVPVAKRAISTASKSHALKVNTRSTPVAKPAADDMGTYDDEQFEELFGADVDNGDASDADRRDSFGSIVEKESVTVIDDVDQNDREIDYGCASPNSMDFIPSQINSPSGTSTPKRVTFGSADIITAPPLGDQKDSTGNFIAGTAAIGRKGILRNSQTLVDQGTTSSSSTQPRAMPQTVKLNAPPSSTLSSGVGVAAKSPNVVTSGVSGKAIRS